MEDYIAKARKLRAIIERAAQSLPDKEGAEVVTLFSSAPDDDAWWDGHLIEAGKRIRFGNHLSRANAAIFAYRHYAPDQAPELWEFIQYRDGYRVIVGAISPVNLVQPGEIVWVGDTKWKNVSGIATSYLPTEYPAGWEMVG